MPFKPGHRRSERFAELLDESDGRLRRHRRSPIDDELAPLAKLAARVGTAAEDPDVEPDFRSGLRSMLMATIEREGVGVLAADKIEQASNRAALVATTEVVRQVRPARRGGTGRTRAAAIVGVMAGALALSGVSAASTNALPGDPLYQVKRSTERAQLALAGSDQSRGRLYLELAAGRLREAGQVDAARVGAVLQDMDDETYAGVNLLNSAAVAGDTTATDSVRSFLGTQRAGLAAFAPTRNAAGGNAAAVRHSTDILGDVAARVDAITAAVAKGCPFTMTPDLLGPVPPC